MLVPRLLTRSVKVAFSWRRTHLPYSTTTARGLLKLTMTTKIVPKLFKTKLSVWITDNSSILSFSVTGEKYYLRNCFYVPYWERNLRLLQVDAGPSGNESFAKNEFWTGILQRNEMGPVLRLVYRTHGRNGMTISINVSVFVTYLLSLRSHVVSYNHTLSSITTHIGQIFRRRGVSH